MTFTLNQPFETDQPTVVVDPGLSPGAYRFRLVVVNRRGRRSKPAEVVVTVERRGTITPPVVVTDPRGREPRPPIPIPGPGPTPTPGPGRVVTPIVNPGRPN